MNHSPVPQPVPQPAADPMLAALSVLERMATQDLKSVDLLLDSIDVRELTMGLVDIAGFMASMLAKASEGSKLDVYAHLRSLILGLVSDGTFNSGPANLPN